MSAPRRGNVLPQQHIAEDLAAVGFETTIYGTDGNLSGHAVPQAPAKSDYVRAGGAVHLLCPLQGQEFTLCGIAFDAYDSENEPSWKFVPVHERPVNCDMCASIIEACRGVRVSAKQRAIRRRE